MFRVDAISPAIYDPVVDEDRRRRYQDKLAHLEERRGDVAAWAGDSDKKSRLAVYKALQEIVEAAMDLCAMWVSDLGVPPKDDYSNLTTLRTRNLIDAETSALLTEANGLRNALVHAYNGIEDPRVRKFIASRLPLFSGFVSAVRKWLS
ncbi:MAG: DUF86 domain-containing protein [Planctomycetes bacterium]|nr:DUF86 domain-containing protein [Planctomycetota bacterium]